MDFIEEIQYLIRHRIPYEEWPKELQIAGVSEDLLGCMEIEKYNLMKKTGYF